MNVSLDIPLCVLGLGCPTPPTTSTCTPMFAPLQPLSHPLPAPMNEARQQAPYGWAEGRG